MKTNKFLILAAVSASLTFTACNNDDDDDDNNTPGACAAPTALTVDDVQADGVTLSWTATAGTDFTVEFGAPGYTAGTGNTVTISGQPVTVSGLDFNTAYDAYVRANCDGSTSAWTGPVSFSTTNPIVGSWTAYDVSGILASLGITGISAQFNQNNTYTVVSSASGANTTFEGTYAVSADASEDGIFSITLNQSVPSSLTSEGIFKVYAAQPDSMWYEVAQTNPSITGVTAPSVEGGFGSTSGGAFGTLNIQKYSRD